MKLLFIILLSYYSVAAIAATRPIVHFKPISIKAILQDKKTPIYTYKVVKAYPHLVSSFTEGLTYYKGNLIESVGLRNHSKILRINIKNGKPTQTYSLPKHYFAEGNTIFHHKLYQLTYTHNTAYVLNPDTFKLIKKIYYPFQGWGLTSNKNSLIMSNGSDALVFLNPNTLHVKRFVRVRTNNQYVSYLNELEYIHGKVFANVFHTSFIAIISPKSGKVLAWVDLRKLNPDPSVLYGHYVLNGIAYNKKNRDYFVTGKTWPYMYEIKLVKKSS